MIKVLKYPYPYKAWLTISNDPDNTTLEAWHELNDFIFKELKLDWANTVFLYNYNLNLPNQVSLDSHPEIANQPIDALHTWGDFVHAGQRGFSRADAEAGIQLLKKHNIQPRIWVDHSRFTGNLLHNNGWGAVPVHTDTTSVNYQVFEYTLDLIKSLGIAYVWNGKLNTVVGQDRPLGIVEGMKLSKAQRAYFAFKILLKGSVGERKRHAQRNEVLQKHTFADGNTLYTFRRFGAWSKADISGLAEILSQKNISTLMNKGGVMIAYTHLGKAGANHDSSNHIPSKTKEALRHIKQLVDSQKLIFTPLSKLLDYLVLRDNIEIQNNEIHLKSDGIRWQTLTKKDLVGHSFSFDGIKNPEEVKVFVNEQITEVKWQHDGQISSFSHY